jgi:rhamnose utilization protein RhaD (predicted bifunctional aldolase and dehydrogenase)
MLTLQELYQLTHTLGEPHRHYVIVGEGNTSCLRDAHSFWIKASGQQMETMTEEGFVAVNLDPILNLLDQPHLTLGEQKQQFLKARVDQNSALMPSVEVCFHAMLLHDCQAQVIGHTHPIAVNKILCSNRAELLATHRIFPDEVVMCGMESVFVPYIDPGLPLAIVMRDRVQMFIEKHQEAPKVILLANHGMIALGQTAKEVLNITAMVVKAAEILLGTWTIGEPNFMQDQDIQHIYKRPDEVFRRKQFVDSHIPSTEA